MMGGSKMSRINLMIKYKFKDFHTKIQIIISQVPKSI